MACSGIYRTTVLVGVWREKAGMQSVDVCTKKGAGHHTGPSSRTATDLEIEMMLETGLFVRRCTEKSHQIMIILK